MEFLPLYLVVGIVAGLLAGLFGVGGGLIIVPAMVFALNAQQVAPELVMHLALGTSLAVILPTAVASVRAHHQRGAVRWDLVFRMAPGIVAGAALGAGIADILSRQVLQTAFGVGELLMAVVVLNSARRERPGRVPATVGLSFASAGIGSLSALGGIGGGTLTVPFLLRCGVAMRECVATSAACGLPIAASGMLGYLLFGLNASNLPPASLGFVYVPAVVGIVAASVFCAPVGARLAHRLPPRTSKLLFAGLLAILGVRMLWPMLWGAY